MRYSLAEIQFLKDNWRLKSHQELGQELGKTTVSIRNKLHKLNLVAPHLWNDNEINMLKALYAEGKYEIDLAGLSDKLGRSKSNISRKARQLKLTNQKRKRRPELRSQRYQREISWREKTEGERHNILSRRSKDVIQKFGHPRGFRELRICLACGRFFDVEHSTPKKYCSRACVSKRLRKMNLYTRSKGGKREDLGGLYLRSRYEANYARYLNFLKERQEIKEWQYEPDTFEFTKIKRGGRFYTPDFKITLTDGSTEYHEVKGWDYPKGITKRKRMAKYFPHIKIVIINEEFFNGVRSQGFHRLIPNWE